MFGFSDVSVELQWEEIPDAKKYELEVQNKSGKVITVVKSDSAYFRFKIKPGRFVARCRALDSRGVPGDWSELTDLEVASPKPKVANFDKPTSLVVPEGETTTELNLSWSAINESAGYEIEIKDSVGKITPYKVTDNSFKLPISTGVYQYRLKALNPNPDEASEFTDWSKPVTVSAPPLEAPSLPEINEEKIANSPPSQLPKKILSKQGAELIVEVSRKYHMSSEWIKLEPIISSTGDINTDGWSPGEYRLGLYFRKSGFPDSTKVIREITVKPTERSILQALSKD